MAKGDTPKKLVDQVQPAPGYLLIEPEETQKQTSSGIYLPETATGDKPQTGKVLSAGLAIFQDGKELAAPAKPLQRVIYKKWGGNEVKLDGKEYLFVKFEDILAVIA
jgi:chaperonin GroES